MNPLILMLTLVLAAVHLQTGNNVIDAIPISKLKKSGISDQRLAELETLMSLSSMRGRMSSGPAVIAYGIIDPYKIGKRALADVIESHEQEKPCHCA